MQSLHVGCKSSSRCCYFYPSNYLLSLKCTLITFYINLELIICSCKVFLSYILELLFYYCKNHISLTHSSVLECKFWVKLTYWYIVKRFFDFGSVRFHLEACIRLPFDLIQAWFFWSLTKKSRSCIYHKYLQNLVARTIPVSILPSKMCTYVCFHLDWLFVSTFPEQISKNQRTVSHSSQVWKFLSLLTK